MDELSYVLWIGGPAGAGKTTIAKRLAKRYGLRWYNSDAQTWQHLERALDAQIPAAQRFDAMTPPERAAASQEEIDYDRGPFVVEDLVALPLSPIIVVDGAPATPSIAPPGQAVWLLPSRQMQRARLEQRHSGSVPPRYLWTWQQAVDRAEKSGASVIDVDDMTVDETVGEVERVFARRLAEGPTASTVEARRDLIRYANQTVVAQHHGWARHSHGRDVTQTVRAFDCECGESTCTATVDLSIGTATTVIRTTAPAIVAAGHTKPVS